MVAPGIRSLALRARIDFVRIFVADAILIGKPAAEAVFPIILRELERPDG